jgi:hypothetical protein
MYNVSLSRSAERFYSSVDRPLAQKLARCFKQLEVDPPVVVAVIAHRREAYG